MGTEPQMFIRRASRSDLETVYAITQRTIAEAYPQYYPSGVVSFFAEYHSRKALGTDIEQGCVLIAEADGVAVGTGTVANGNYITRVYVLAEHQGNGYGARIIDELERAVAQTHDSATLDASDGAYEMWLRRGYVTEKHTTEDANDGCKLSYYTMRKRLETVPNGAEEI